MTQERIDTLLAQMNEIEDGLKEGDFIKAIFAKGMTLAEWTEILEYARQQKKKSEPEA